MFVVSGPGGWGSVCFGGVTLLRYPHAFLVPIIR